MKKDLKEDFFAWMGLGLPLNSCPFEGGKTTSNRSV